MYLPKNAFVCVKREGGGPHHIGGDQAWLEGRVSRGTCCGGIALVNMLCSLTGRTGPMEKREYLMLYRSCFPRPLSGFIPFARTFAAKLKKCLKKYSLHGKTRILGSLTVSPQRAFEAISRSISSGIPVALQNWAGPKKPVRRYHWVTVIGLEGADAQSAVLLVSSWGRVYRYPLASVWRGKSSLVTVELI